MKVEKKIEKERKEKLAKKKRRRITVDYCCNPRCFVCRGIIIPPHYLEYYIMRLT